MVVGPDGFDLLGCDRVPPGTQSLANGARLVFWMMKEIDENVDDTSVIARDERKSDVALRDRAGDRKVAAARPIPGEPLALGAGRGGKCRKLRRYFERGRGACLLETRNGHLDGLVRVERLLFKGGQFVALENAPPFAFGDPVFGGAFAPRLGDIPLGGNGSGSPLVLRPHGTAE